ncbi:MAG: preprotein translocase subunit SecY [Bacilli bacterium]|nr:preprotein translocase subunit SecY [Bacilli bacterium]MDD4298428.1 preprotein translocase subunit SecY [Bacilli bacterium]
MFVLLKQLFSPKNKDILRRVSFTLLALFIFKLGTMIQVPGTESITKNLGFLELMNAMGGGAFKQFSIFALGVSPYISASIVTQLLQMDIVPYFSELAKQGPSGRRKINKINRYMGIAIAFLQGYVFSFAFLPEGSGALEYMRISIILTAGTAFILWLGDQITQKGIGNGISLIIMSGILMTTPTMFINAFNEMVKTTSTQAIVMGIVSFSIFVLVYLAIVIGVIFIQQAERRIPIQYSNKTSSAYESRQNYMPIKVNSAGVMPVIFASMVVAIPSTIAQFLKNDKFMLFVEKYLNYDTVTGFAFYMLMIIFFAYFYTYMQLNPDEMASNFQKQGGYIPGIRPGKETASYIKQILSRLTIIGALFLIIIAGLPIVFSNVSNLSANITIGGTGLLIVVGVALETYSQLESRLLTRNYGGRW